MTDKPQPEMSGRADPLAVIDGAIAVLPNDTYVLGQGFRSKRGDDLRQVRADVAALVEAAQTLDSLYAESEAHGVDFSRAIERLRAALAPFGDKP